MKNEIIQMFTKQGFAKVNYPSELKQAVERVAKAWAAFCSQSVNHKELIPFEKNGGYENKDRRINPESRDHKEDFHVTRNYELPSSFNAKPADIELISSGKNLFEKIRPTLIYIAHAMSEATGIDFVKLAVEDEDGWVLRLLHYYPGNMDKIPAKEHYDKGGYTLHLRDSTPGFEKYWKDKWQPIKFSEDELVFFPGLLGQLESKCLIHALSHRVVSTQEIFQKGRYSLVLFNDYPSSLFTYDRDKFGPVQNIFKPGMAELMPFDELVKYFKKRTTQDAR